MGITFKSILVKKEPHDVNGIHVKFLIDSGAGYSLIPSKILQELGVQPHGEVELELADGTSIKRKLGGAYFEYNGDGGVSPVIFGEKGEEPLLGALTLEALRLVHNPYRREVYPQRVVRI
jgi:predicted aspartyl protease